ncbi:flippase-like domain-containing protein [Candidatus Binatia bacterium]|nr:flippase-like domain-containing protein [Candidatus Binatia bacterium]
MNRTLRIVLSIAISVVFLTIAVWNVDWRQAGAALARAHYIYVVPMFLVTVWTLYIRAQRWRLLLRPLGNPPMGTLIAATNIGFMANMVLPLRAGEVIRPVLLSRKEREPLGGVLATIVLERIFDMMMVLLLFGVSFVAVPVSDEVRRWGYFVLFTAVAVAAGVAAIRWQEATALRLLARAVARAPASVGHHLDHFFRGFIRALEILDNPWTFLQAIAWSLYLWIVIASTYFWGLLAFDLPVPWVVGSLVITSLIAIAVSAPSAPGYIGAFQVGCALALGLFGISESDAFAYSIVLHLTQFAGTIAAGLYSLTREGMTFQQIEHVSETDGAAT